MEIIIHRVNSIKKLKQIPTKFGVEIDVRSLASKIIINHEPKKKGDRLVDFLKIYNHGTIIFNIKEAGIEKEIIFLAKKYKVKSFFLLDVEHPFIITSKKKNKKYLSSRFSEYEPLDLSIHFKSFISWIWIDTINKLPLNKNNIQIIKKFKSCLVSPERWNREKDIKKYINFFRKNNFKPSAIMTELKYSKIWESL